MDVNELASNDVILKSGNAKLVKALATIHDFCDNYGICDRCPFYDEQRGCLLAIPDVPPCEWKIKYEADLEC